MAISSRTVLIVAGDARSADAFHHTLDDEAHRLVEVSCLKDALAIAAREPLDVVVADTALPDGTGLALLHEVQRLQPATMRILLTSPAGVSLALEAMEHGEVYRFLVKPLGRRRAPRRGPCRRRPSLPRARERPDRPRPARNPSGDR